MKIIALLSRVPWPLEKGDKLRAYHQLRCLSEKHTVVLFAISHGRIHPKAIEELKKFCHTVHLVETSLLSTLFNMGAAWLKGLPAQAGYFFNKKAYRKLKSLIAEENPDHLYCQLVRMGEYSKGIHLPKTLDYQDVFSEGVKRRMEKASWWVKPFFKMEYKRMAAYESTLFDCFDNKTIIAATDRDLIQHPLKHQIHIIENGVDTAFFTEIPHEKDTDLVFTGNMSYPPNVLAAEFIVNQIVPACQKLGFTPTVLLAGATPAPRVKLLASNLVRVTGWIDDIRTAYARSKIFIAPMQIGTGLQNKLLEAMSMKIPSITSALANSSLGANPDKEVLIGDTAMDYARLIHLLLENPAKASDLAQHGQNFVKTNFNWEASTRRLETIITTTIKTQTAAD